MTEGEKRTRPEKMRLPVLLCVLVCVCAAPGPVAGADRSCSDLPQFYTGKGFTLADVPQTEMSGEFWGKIVLHKIKKNNTISCNLQHLTSQFL